MRFAFVAAAIVCAAAAALLSVPAVLAHDPISTKVTWDGELKRLIDARCVSCHSPGGRAPMSLTTYEEARPWARAIREEVLTRRMPKWHVVRGYGDFANDPSLSSFEVALFAAWADGGAPKTLPPRPGAPKGTPATAAAAPLPTLTSQAARARPGPRHRSVEIPCTARTLPAGRVVGLKPVLAEGADLKATLTGSDGSIEPLLWIRSFDPQFAETYWLRRPLEVTRAMRVEMDGTAPCRLTVLLAAGTAQ